MIKAVFLDRDGTINIEKNYLYKIEDFEFIDGVIEALMILQDAGYKLFIVTNQSGIGRGFYTEQDFNVLTEWVENKLRNEGITIEKTYFCPHLPNAIIKKYRKDCECRKPKIGMYNEAVKEYDINLSKSWAIGDKIRDSAICENSECRGFLICNNEKKEVIEAVKNGQFHNVSYAKDILECAKAIVRMED